MTQSAPVFVPSLLTIAVLLITAGVAHTSLRRGRRRKKELLGSAAAPTEQPLPPAHNNAPAGADPDDTRTPQQLQVPAQPNTVEERFTPEFLELLDTAISNAEGRPNWPLQVSGTPRTNSGHVNIIITFTPQQPKPGK